MAVRTVLILSFVTGAIFGATSVWLFEDSPKPSGTVVPGGGSEIEAPGPVATRNEPRCPEGCSEDLERARFELARERQTVAQLSEDLKERRSALQEPLPNFRRRKRDQTTGFDSGALQAIGFSPDDIEWIREIWEQFEVEKSYLADLEARDEEPPWGGALSDVERELRQDLGDNAYDAMLYATHQSNRVALERIRNGSIAERAGLRDGSVIWSYDGQRVFNSKELATLSTTGRRGEPVEIAIVTDEGTQRLFIERNPLGADLVSALGQPTPD